MKRLLAFATLCTAAPAYAADPQAMIAQCNAPMARAIEVAAQSDAQSAQWSNLNIAIQAHRRACGVPMALACHLSEAPAACYADVTAALDARAQAQWQKLQSYADEGGHLFGALPEALAQTSAQRAADRGAFCGQQGTDASAYVGVLGGDANSACLLDVAAGQWASIAFSASAPQALSLLPPQ